MCEKTNKENYMKNKSAVTTGQDSGVLGPTCAFHKMFLSRSQTCIYLYKYNWSFRKVWLNTGWFPVCCHGLYVQLWLVLYLFI